MSEFNHIKDFPFTAMYEGNTEDGLAREPRFMHLYAASPHDAMQQYNAADEQKRRFIQLFHGHVNPVVSAHDDQTYQLRAGPVPREAQDILSSIRSGEDRFALMSGFFGREETVFLVEIVVGGFHDEKTVMIYPRFVALTDQMGALCRSADGESLVKVETEKNQR